MRIKSMCVASGLLFVTVLPSAKNQEGDNGGRSTRLNAMVSLLDQNQVLFGLTVNFRGVGNSPIDAMNHSANENIDLVMYDLEHNPFDVTELRTYMQFLLDPGGIAKAGHVSACPSQ